MRILELFSGTRSVGKVAAALGWESVSLDLKDADIEMDILKWDYTVFPPGYFDIIWASFPCETFSTTRWSNIGRMGRNGKLWTHERIRHDMETKGLPLLRRSQEIIDYFKPKAWFLENPATGHAKDFIGAPTYVVDYCQYAPEWGYRKRTAVWTNVVGFKPKTCVPSECAATEFYPPTGRIRHRLCTDAGNAARGLIGTTTRDRYRIPPALIRALFACCV